jgi:putative membrane protein
MFRASLPFALAAAAVVTAATLSADVPGSQIPPALDDPTIVAIFDAANTFDIEAGQLAADRSKDQGTLTLAQHFIHDHTAVRQQGRDLAAKLGVKPTPPADFALAREHAAAMAELKGKTGAEFDRAYAAHEVAFHQAVIDALKTTLIPAIGNAELKTFVSKVEPAFEGHLAAARALAKKLEART